MNITTYGWIVLFAPLTGAVLIGLTFRALPQRIHGVRDFLYWYKWVDWPVFNVADICLVCGASMLLLEAVFAKAPSESGAAQTVASLPGPVPNEVVSVP